MTDEPLIAINGVDLTEAQSMAVRVAVSTFLAEMAQPGALGDDEHGHLMAEAYRLRLTEVVRLMVGAPV